MSQRVRWYRSSAAAPPVLPSVSRRVRNWLRARLPEPDVRGRTMVLYSRRTFPRPSSNGVRSDFHGLFSEFHSVLGALAYGHAHGAAGVRVDFRSPLYTEADRGPRSRDLCTVIRHYRLSTGGLPGLLSGRCPAHGCQMTYLSGGTGDRYRPIWHQAR